MSILTPVGEVAPPFDLTHLEKGRDRTPLTCYVSGATATLSLERNKNPPELQVIAGQLFPVFDAAYRLDRAEHKRSIKWINGLSIGGQV